MPKLAIAVPYCESQNEPSRPFSQLIELPDNIASRDKMLKKFFVDNVCDDEDAGLVVRKGKKGIDYGDLVVDSEIGVYLYLTYVS